MKKTLQTSLFFKWSPKSFPNEASKRPEIIFVPIEDDQHCCCLPSTSHAFCSVKIKIFSEKWGAAASWVGIARWISLFSGILNRYERKSLSKRKPDKWTGSALFLFFLFYWKKSTTLFLSAAALARKESVGSELRFPFFFFLPLLHIHVILSMQKRKL